MLKPIRKLNILIITNLYPNPMEPQRSVYVSQLVRYIRESCDITILSPLPWFPKLKVLKGFKKWYKFALIPPKATMNNQLVYYRKYLVIPKILGGTHSLSLYLSISKTVNKLHKYKQFDIIHGKWMFPDGAVASKIALKLGVPCVLSAHGCDINRDSKDRFKGPQIVRALQQCNKVIAVSRPLGEAIHSLGISEQKISVIQNGVDLELFTIKDKIDSKKRLGLNPDDKMILFVGELAEVKGVEYLLSAVKRLKDNTNINFKVNLVGTGALHQILEKQSHKLDIQDIVTFRGLKPHNEIADWIAASDLFCLPSIREGTPNVILESLASGRPVVASRVGGIPDLVNESNAILFPAEDDRALYEALYKALSQEWNPFNIRDSIKNRSWQSVAQEYLSEFNKVIN